jgi:hypothetical protein
MLFLFCLGLIDSKFNAYLKQHFLIDVGSTSSHSKQEQLFVFKESINYDEHEGFFKLKPVSHLNVGNELPYSIIQQTLDANKLLYLPRVSSMQHFLEICQSQNQGVAVSL